MIHVEFSGGRSIEEINQPVDQLLAVPIKDDEIHELLERLAATEEMFKSPVSTIRDVAELTDASPTLIARILGEMRGPDEIEKLSNRVDSYEARLRKVEDKIVSAPPRHVQSTPAFGTPPILAKPNPAPPKRIEQTTYKAQATSEDWDRYRKWIAAELKVDPYEEERNSRRTSITFGVVIIAIIFFLFAVASVVDSSPQSRPGLPPPYESR